MLNKEIFIKRTPPPPLHWMHKDCLIYPDFTTTVCHKTYSTSLLHSLTVCPLSVSLFSAPQTPGCVGQIHGRHQKLYLQNVPWLKRFSSWLAPLFSPLYPRFVFCLPPPTEAIIFALQVVISLFSIHQQWCIRFLKPHYHFQPPCLHP